MRKSDKLLVILLGIIILFSLLRKMFLGEPRQEIIIAGMHIDKQPCLSAMNELFSKGVDSTKMCDCLLPKFYELIKNDPEKVKHFEEVDFFTVQDAANDTVIQTFGRCVTENIVDTSYKLNLAKFREPFLKKMKDTLSTIDGLSKPAIDSISNCLIQHFDGNITIKEYFADDYLKVGKLKIIMQDCLGNRFKRND